jgi:hypothetical protein
MKDSNKIIFALCVICFSCGLERSEKANKGKEYLIPDIEFNKFTTSDSTMMTAVARARAYLATTDNGNFYLDSIYTRADTVVMMVNHEDYYIEWRRMKEEEERQRKIKENGDTVKDYLWVPPNGSWSGKDRAILYLSRKDSLIDVLFQ